MDLESHGENRLEIDEVGSLALVGADARIFERLRQLLELVVLPENMAKRPVPGAPAARKVELRFRDGGRAECCFQIRYVLVLMPPYLLEDLAVAMRDNAVLPKAKIVERRFEVLEREGKIQNIDHVLRQAALGKHVARDSRERNRNRGHGKPGSDGAASARAGRDFLLASGESPRDLRL